MRRRGRGEMMAEKRVNLIGPFLILAMRGYDIVSTNGNLFLVQNLYWNNRFDGSFQLVR